MIPNKSESKHENIASRIGSNKQNHKFLKSALIYGPNASGKSTIIRGIYEITALILKKPKVDEPLQLSAPYSFDTESIKLPSEYEIEFLGPENVKYIYSFNIHNNKITKELLYYFPNKRKTKLFERQPIQESELIQKGKLGDSLLNKEISVFQNQLILSKFGDDEPHEILTNVFLYFKKFNIVNAVNSNNVGYVQRSITKKIFQDQELKELLDKLIHFADTKILRTEIEEEVKSSMSRSGRDKFIIRATHAVFEKGNKIDETSIDFKQESTGTQVLFTIGGLILETLKSGGILIIDELDTSLHPFLTKLFLVLFNSQKINTNHSQLIFTSHDVTLMDRELVRRDQVWITDKNDKGVSDLYSLQDFEGLREDTPFEKWYLAGKFGGLPKLKSVESIFD